MSTSIESDPNSAAAADPAAPSASRRRWLLAGAGVAAAAAGAGFAWWRFEPHAVSDGVEASFWNASMETLDGSTLTMRKFHGRPLLLNFWATWCPPCVEELPLLNGFYNKYAGKGFQVLGLAIDKPDAVRKFLERTPLDFPIALAGLTGTDLGRALGNELGGLPFSVLFGKEGNILKRKMGQLTEQDVAQWASQT
ncbi:TlpA disulfide reductase family protein [Diaphorobacter aerolatus]|uniref:TlpA family protein disulfide reductase n=1 Tax=Diaphorobacter aerolatus TaxID=1288495 RepID=A0A7H0GHI8_9BURK|nr:TlpA disulfide reductase family protein [Diaphorobacter aerolatus]QNP47754.1 TlpA family protein disulfide reductase [Diaphorobacter aerolatus]